MIYLLLAVGALFGALGRHHQGGASHRWIGMLLYIPVLIPSVVFLPYWQSALLVVGWYGWMLMKEQFGSLWHSTWRYGGPVFFASIITLNWWVIPGAPILWFACKWARDGHKGVSDPHRIFEYVLGATLGLIWVWVSIHTA